MSNFNVTYEHLVETISEELQHLKQVNDINNLKTDSELIKLICKSVDVYISKHSHFNIDKNNLILDVIIKLFDITHDEKNYILHKIRIVENNTNKTKRTYFEWLCDIFNYICCAFS